MKLRMELQRSTPRYRALCSSALLPLAWAAFVLGGGAFTSCHGAPHNRNREDVVLADDEPFNR